MKSKGILIIDKPPGWTSFDCVAVCRSKLKELGIKKIGHGGTLDPMAEGLLPVMVGKATRITEYLNLDLKKYSCCARLGIITDTQDVWGEILETKSFRLISEDDIRRASERLCGNIMQIPPSYSAVRVNGKRLYEYAREGKSVEAPARQIHIESLTIQNVDLSRGTFEFEVSCSKGTYVRTICDRIGRILGCGCAMSSLRRLEVGALTLKHALNSEHIKQMTGEELSEHMLPIELALNHLGDVVLGEIEAGCFANGRGIAWEGLRVARKPKISDWYADKTPVTSTGIFYDHIYTVHDDAGNFLGIGHRDDGRAELEVDKVLI